MTRSRADRAADLVIAWSGRQSLVYTCSVLPAKTRAVPGLSRAGHAAFFVGLVPSSSKRFLFVWYKAVGFLAAVHAAVSSEGPADDPAPHWHGLVFSSFVFCEGWATSAALFILRLLAACAATLDDSARNSCALPPVLSRRRLARCGPQG